MKYSAIAILVAGVLVSGTALAGAQGRHDEGKTVQISELKGREHALERQNLGPGNLGAGGREEIARERREIRKMIEQLEAGKTVEPREMER